MKKTNVKSHKRKGKMVKSHARNVKGSDSSNQKGLTKEQCMEKYKEAVEQFGEDSPQAKKLAMKIESYAKVKKHQRIMRKDIDEEILVKNSRKKK